MRCSMEILQKPLGRVHMALHVQKARELDPDAKLFVNDYNIITYVEGDAYIRQIEWLLQTVPR